MGCESTKNSHVDNRLLDDLFEKSNFVNHEQIQELHRMERLWRLYCYRPQVGHCNQQDPPVFYLCFNTYDGFASYYLPGACFLEKHQEVYMGGKKESLVLSIKNKGCKFLQPLFHKKQKCLPDRIEKDRSIFSFYSEFFFSIFSINKSYLIWAC